MPHPSRPRSFPSPPVEFNPTHDQEWGIYLRGIELFNHREWFEAHEIWEDNWHLAEGPRKRFYQGLIQVAVTLEHARRGNPRGVRTVWTSSRGKFVELPDWFLGLRIPELLDGVGEAIQPVLNLAPSEFRPGLPHGRDLPTRWDRVPQIRLDWTNR
ncbi:MAG: DUF309 domain-containing protein [Phycisphaeraceae bacterium]|nr:DUF309 domain-containing protein [Phycisphaeraceae bacterium]